MPTILRFGGLRVVIYTNDHGPPHVHVIGRGAAARIALGSEGKRPWLITNEGLSRRELGKALVEIDRNRTLLMRGGERFMATPDWVKKELRSNFARASRAGRRAAKTEPRAARATYLARQEALRIELINGVAITVPVKLIPGLKGAAPSEVGAVEVLGRGSGLHWEHLDLDLSVPALVSSVFAGREWMAELGRVGGRRSSAAKAAAARRNGHKGGRPRVHAMADTDV